MDKKKHFCITKIKINSFIINPSVDFAINFYINGYRFVAGKGGIDFFNWTFFADEIAITEVIKD